MKIRRAASAASFLLAATGTAIAAEVPGEIKRSRRLRLAVTATDAPMEYKDKDSIPLREVVTETLRAMIADGSYKAILDRYGLGANAATEPLPNAGPR